MSHISLVNSSYSHLQRPYISEETLGRPNHILQKKPYYPRSEKTSQFLTPFNSTSISKESYYLPHRLIPMYKPCINQCINVSNFALTLRSNVKNSSPNARGQTFHRNIVETEGYELSHTTATAVFLPRKSVANLPQYSSLIPYLQLLKRAWAFPHPQLIEQSLTIHKEGLENDLKLENSPTLYVNGGMTHPGLELSQL